MATIGKEQIIADVLKKDKGSAKVFLKYGMHCIGCPVASGESIEQAATAHGVDVDKLVDELNEYFDQQ